MTVTLPDVDLDALLAEPDPACGWTLPERPDCPHPAVAVGRIVFECGCRSDGVVPLCAEHEAGIRVIIAHGVLFPCPRCGVKAVRWRLS